MAKIGIFDSGYGGLTILEAIRKELPQYDYIYLGDNARAPYGTHSFDVIYRYTWQAVKYLFEQDCALVILACNTASAKALRTIQQKDLPALRKKNLENLENLGSLENLVPLSSPLNVLGVIRPTVEAVPSITKTGHIGVLATPATVSSESYVLELQKLQKLPKIGHLEKLEHLDSLENLSSPFKGTEGNFSITQQPCPLWVPLIENGEQNSEGTDFFVDKYLREILAKDPLIDTLILGCTHYPLLLPKIAQWIRNNGKRFASSRPLSTTNGLTPSAQTPAVGDIQIISQGYLVAHSLADYLTRHSEYTSQLSLSASCRYLTTENADRFAQSASLFLSSPISAEHIDLE